MQVPSPRMTALLRTPWPGFIAALAMIALVSGLSGLLAGHGRVADLYLLYLVGVLAVALAFGRGPATLAAITAVLTADFFFVGPTHAFTLVAPRRYPTEWIELHVLLAATLLTGLLAGGYRQRARAALRASEERNHTLVRNTVEAISVFEPATKRVVEVNPAFLRLLGYTGAEATTLTLYDVVAHERTDVDAFVRRTLLQGTVADGEQAWRRKDGQLLEVQVTAAAIRNDGHEFCFFVGRDVTARRGVERALRASEERLRTLMTNAPVVLFSIDPAGIFTLSEGKGLAALGLRSGEVVGQSAFDLYGDVPALVADARRVLGGEAFTAIREVAGATFESWYAPLHDPDGAVRGAIGVSTDITARARIDAALRASEARFRAVFESAAVGMALVDLDGRPVASNPALQALLGYDTDELRGMTFAQCTHPDDVDADLALYRELAAGTREAYQLEKRYVRKDGAVLYGRLTVSLARDAAGVPQFAVGMVEDVTQYKRSSAELAEARRRLAEIREAERLRLARDLHDDAMQELYGIRFGLILSQRRAAGGAAGDALVPALNEAQIRVQVVIDTLRGLIGELRPAGLEDLGLAAALDSYVAYIRGKEDAANLDIALDLDPDGVDLPLSAARCLFRVAQEALRNVRHHAQACHAIVTLHLHPDEVVLSIRDDGQGFEPPARLSALAQRDHFGLIGLAEQVGEAGGQLTIASRSGAGTAVTVRLPLREGAFDA